MVVNRREFLAAGAAAFAATACSTSTVAQAPPPARTQMGVVIHSYGLVLKNQNLSDPLTYLEYLHKIGAGGGQLGIGQRDEAYAEKVRKFLADRGMFLEGSIRLPQAAGDMERFAAEVRTAKACGATTLRTAALSSRRYETFATAAEFARFATAAWESLLLAKPVLEREQLRLAVENHKDWRVHELLGLVRRLDSPLVGICIDTGNSIALLEEPLEVVEAYAPHVLSTHIKDMGVEEYPEGFRLAEVPLGKGMLDLPKLLGVIRQKNPAVRLNLEMITRDPLEVPCLTDKYWATFTGVGGQDLARMLSLVRRKAGREPLPRVAGLSPAEKAQREEDNVRDSLAFAREKLSV